MKTGQTRYLVLFDNEYWDVYPDLSGRGWFYSSLDSLRGFIGERPQNSELMTIVV